MSEPARFDLSPPLLAQLRELRAQQRARRVQRAQAAASRGVESLTGSAESESTAAAAAFVAGMDALQTEVEEREDAFLLDPGMGPMRYLTTDGRVLEDHRTWDGDGPRESTSDDAIAALVVGAKKTGITDLLRLVPPCPVDGAPCPRCDGERWDKPLRDHGLQVVCTLCRGRGWMTPALLDAATAATAR